MSRWYFLQHAVILSLVTAAWIVLGNPVEDSQDSQDSNFLNGKQISCPDGLIEQLKNATTWCTQVAAAQSDEEDAEESLEVTAVETTGGAVLLDSSSSHAATELSSAASTEQETATKDRRRRESEVTPHANDSAHHHHTEEQVLQHVLSKHAPVVYCAVEKLRAEHPVLEAIIDYCNSSFAPNTSEGTAEDATTAKDSTAESENATEDSKDHTKDEDEHHHHHHVHHTHSLAENKIMIMAQCMDEKLRMVCPKLEIAAHIHSL